MVSMFLSLRRDEYLENYKFPRFPRTMSSVVSSDSASSVDESFNLDHDL